MEGFIFIFSFFAIVSSSLMITRKCVHNGLNEKVARVLFGIFVGTGVGSLMLVLTRKVNDPEDVPGLFLVIALLFGFIAWVNTKGSLPVRERGTLHFKYKKYHLLLDPINLSGGIKKTPELLKETWKDLGCIHKALPILFFVVCLTPPLVLMIIAVYVQWLKS